MLDGLKENIVALGMIVLIAAAIGLTVDSFQNDIEDDNPCTNSSATWNTSSNLCQLNATDTTTISGTSYAYNISQSGLDGVSNTSDYFDTIGTLMGVGALIAVVMGAFYFMRQ